MPPPGSCLTPLRPSILTIMYVASSSTATHLEITPDHGAHCCRSIFQCCSMDGGKCMSLRNGPPFIANISTFILITLTLLSYFPMDRWINGRRKLCKCTEKRLMLWSQPVNGGLPETASSVRVPRVPLYRRTTSPVIPQDRRAARTILPIWTQWRRMQIQPPQVILSRPLLQGKQCTCKYPQKRQHNMRTPLRVKRQRGICELTNMYPFRIVSYNHP